MTTKKFAYLFLIVCIGIAGYFAYDTYRVVSEEDNDKDTNKEEQAGSSNLKVKYNDYSVDKELKYSLAEVKEDRTVLYFYEKEVGCSDIGVLRSGYQGLGLVITIDRKVKDTGTGAIMTSSLYIRDVEGTYLEITGIPPIKNIIKLDETDSSKVKGELELTWENRSYKGGFEATVCTDSKV